MLVMLVLSRESGKAFLIGDDVRITVVEIRGGKVRLGVEAPDHLTVRREELQQEAKLRTEAAEQELQHPSDAHTTENGEHDADLLLPAMLSSSVLALAVVLAVAGGPVTVACAFILGLGAFSYLMEVVNRAALRSPAPRWASPLNAVRECLSNEPHALEQTR